MKILCDQMLGTLAKWLRICGFDTYYANNLLDDNDLLKIAEKENRVLITRDKELVYNARRRNLNVIQIDDTNLDEQLKIIFEKYSLDDDLFLSRCLLCNTIIKPIKKENIKGKVPERVFESNENFWYCKKCKKYYWKGTHFENMINKINNLFKNNK